MALTEGNEDRFTESNKPIVGAPVPDEEAIQNIKDSALFNLPILTKSKEAPTRGTLVFVAGGPTLLKYVDEIRQRMMDGDFIMTSNNTHDWLIDRGIIPNACLLLDPKERVKGYVTKWQKDCHYYLTTVCNKGVYEAALAAGVRVTKVLIGYGMENDKDITLQNELYPNYRAADYLLGGTMTPLRVMPMSVMMGFTKIEYYGFDSCFSEKEPELIYDDDPRYAKALEASGGIMFEDTETKRRYVLDEGPEGGFFYAYKKPRPENVIVVATADGRRFATSPGFENQARQISKWVDRLEGRLDVVIHGDSLSSHALRLHREAKEARKKAVGDRRWTLEYAELQRKLHAEGNYGLWGAAKHKDMLGRSSVSIHVQLQRRVSILDYGCGNGALGDDLEKTFNFVSVTNYDPFQEKYSAEPGVHDIVTCFDVMEHVEEECVENTLRYIASKTKYLAFFNISTREADKTLADGRNAHITQRSAQWWVTKLKEHFVPLEAKVGDDFVVVVCQSLDAAARKQEEMKSLQETVHAK